MSIEAWAEAARRSQYRQDAEQQHAIDTLKYVFEGKSEPNSGASTIASIYEPLLKRGFKHSPVTELWGIICEAVQILGGDRKIDDRLILLLNTLSKLPDVTDKDGKPITGGEIADHGVYWKDLPNLAMMFRQYAIDIEPGTSEMPDEGDWTDAQKATLLNVVTFGALYLAHGHQNIGMPFHAEVSLMEGIETPYQTPEEQRRAATVVPPAATWILLAGNKIYELCKGDHQRKTDQGRGYSLDRWALWKRRFGEIANINELSDSVKGIASKAASNMERIGG